MPKKQRITRADFSTLSPRRQSRLFGVYFSASVSYEASKAATLPRYACVVSKKVAPKAHDRNLIKRRCREAIRPHLKEMQAPLALVLHARKEVVGTSFASIREDLDNLLQSCQ